MNPGTGGVIQRRARARPNDCTLPDSASESSARCTVRWLVPSASARAELDQDSPSAKKASTAPFASSTGRASTTTSRARRGISAKPASSHSRRPTSKQSCEASPISTRNRAAMRFIHESRSEGPRHQHIPRHVTRPRFAQRACEREQHRTRCQRNHFAPDAYYMTACVNHQRFRRQQRFNLIKQERPLLATRNQARRRRVQNAGRAFNLRRQCRDTCVPGGAVRSRQRSARRFVCRRRIAIPATTRSWTALNAGGKGVGSRSMSTRSASSRRPISRRRRTSRYRACAAFNRSPCVSSVARAESSDFAGQLRSREASATSASATTHLARATYSFGAEGTPRASQKFLRSCKFAKLRHRDASKRQRRRIVAQRDPLQCAERITCRQRTCCGR